MLTLLPGRTDGGSVAPVTEEPVVDEAGPGAQQPPIEVRTAQETDATAAPSIFRDGTLSALHAHDAAGGAEDETSPRIEVPR